MIFCSPWVCVKWTSEAARSMCYQIPLIRDMLWDPHKPSKRLRVQHYPFQQPSWPDVSPSTEAGIGNHLVTWVSTSLNANKCIHPRSMKISFLNLLARSLDTGDTIWEQEVWWSTLSSLLRNSWNQVCLVLILTGREKLTSTLSLHCLSVR